MSKAYLDTTILTDFLLGIGQTRERTVKALKRYTETQLPQYAIKKFRAGPLAAHVWMHNVLAQQNSFKLALNSLQRLFSSWAPLKIPALNFDLLESRYHDSWIRGTDYGPTGIF